jgi:GMP synthase (glutamine-hydrolysing)
MSIGTNKVYKYRFDRSFYKNIKLHYIHWTKKNIIEYIKHHNIKGIILTGSKYRILHEHKRCADLPKKILKLNIPILGICYGYQWLIKKTCGKKCLSTFPNKKKSRHITSNIITKPFKITKKMYKFVHYDYISKVPKHWNIVIKKGNQIWMSYDKKKKIIGIQFHPEAVKKTRKLFFRNWIKYICKK